MVVQVEIIPPKTRIFKNSSQISIRTILVDSTLWLFKKTQQNNSLQHLQQRKASSMAINCLDMELSIGTQSSKGNRRPLEKENGNVWITRVRTAGVVDCQKLTSTSQVRTPWLVVELISRFSVAVLKKKRNFKQVTSCTAQTQTQYLGYSRKSPCKTRIRRATLRLTF